MAYNALELGIDLDDEKKRDFSAAECHGGSRTVHESNRPLLRMTKLPGEDLAQDRRELIQPEVLAVKPMFPQPQDPE